MNKEPQLEDYLAFCQRVFERMKRDGSWPWRSDDEQHDNQPNHDL